MKHLFKLMECKTPRANPSVNYGLGRWGFSCQCRFTNCNRCTLWLHCFACGQQPDAASQVWAITPLPSEKSINLQRLLQQHSLVLCNRVTVTSTRPQSLPMCRASDSVFRPVPKYEQRAKDRWTSEENLQHKTETPKQTEEGSQNKTETYGKQKRKQYRREWRKIL